MQNQPRNSYKVQSVIEKYSHGQSSNQSKTTFQNPLFQEQPQGDKFQFTFQNFYKPDLDSSSLYDNFIYLKNRIIKLQKKPNISKEELEEVKKDYQHITEKYVNGDMVDDAKLESNAKQVFTSMISYQKEEVSNLFNFIYDFLKKERIVEDLGVVTFEMISTYKGTIKLLNNKNKKEQNIFPTEEQSTNRRREYTEPVSRQSFSDLKFSNQRKSEAEVFSERQIQVNENKLDMTILPSFPKKMDDSFYSSETIKLQKMNDKLAKLQHQLEQELVKNAKPYTGMILCQMIQDLNSIFDTTNSQLVKTIIYRIEEGIEKLKDQNEGSLTLFNYLNKALRNGKKKLISLNSKYEVEQQTLHQNQFRYSEKVNLTHQNLEHYQPRSTAVQQEVRQSQSLYFTQKRRFYDLALKKKNQISSIKTILVSELYDEFIKLRLEDSQMENFIDSKLMK